MGLKKNMVTIRNTPTAMPCGNTSFEKSIFFIEASITNRKIGRLPNKLDKESKFKAAEEVHVRTQYTVANTVLSGQRSTAFKILFSFHYRMVGGHISPAVY